MVVFASNVPRSSYSPFGSILTLHLLHLLSTVRHSNSLTYSLSSLSWAGFTHMVLCFLFLRAFWLEDFFLAETGTVLFHPGWRSANGVVVFLQSMIMLSLMLGGLGRTVFWCEYECKSQRLLLDKDLRSINH